MIQTTPALRVQMIMLGVADVERSVAFYTEKLGFTLANRFGDFAFIDGNGIALVLSRELAEARPSNGPTAVEIVLGVESVGAAYDALRARGLTFDTEPHVIDGTHHVANFTDPDGHELSLYGLP